MIRGKSRYRKEKPEWSGKTGYRKEKPEWSCKSGYRKEKRKTVKRAWKRVIKNALRGSKGDAQGDDLFFPMYTYDTYDT